MELLDNITGFEWGEGNINKNWVKHKVSNSECEEIFFYEPSIGEDTKHSKAEKRYAAYGMTANGRYLTIIFTVRNDKIRVISARDQQKKEKAEYEKNQKNTKI
ncbi:MAG: BrnT family toxin [Ignavibacteriae bacterium]|nr:MAG: BrnT family toxin [Ignavibacteriota bacterium]